ncbi:luciferin sulfotransferase-like isoform X1 [Phlebotomus argentipes]|uniref:luciferin sulfotransferase-like isoform X1 n=1 Tax=Phlebotomus argentipes TaxID=94469 RepID=UPI0028935008|nr:luciferin sulfotransferase-like isoform X1 [Phlebotomus argentipes]
MPVVCEPFAEKELISRVKYAGIDEFVYVKNPSKDFKEESYFLPALYANSAEKISNFRVRSDDVWVATFPKCGTTWSLEMIWMLCNGLDYETSRNVDQNARFPFLEVHNILSRELNLPDGAEILEKTESPRFIKTHLPAPLLPKEIWTVRPKLVYVARNVKDAAISFYHHYRNIFHYTGSLEDFLENFMNDKVVYAPYHSHISEYWQRRNEENILFLTYEDMKKDHPRVIEKTAKFFGKSYTKEQILELANYLDFSNFSKNYSVNHEEGVERIQRTLQLKKPDDDYRFIRRGEVGSHRDEMPKDMIEKFNEWTERKIEKAQLGPEIRTIFNRS